MNRIYRSIWNDTTGTFVAVSEISKSAGKKSSPVSGSGFGHAGFALKALASSLLMMFGSTLYALPANGVVAAGSANIATNGARNLIITQTSQNAALNWQSFSIGAGEAVQFLQPNSNSVAMNRVLGSDPSNILGSLTANGKVFLVNPNGILFGQGASVNVGGLVASTRDISDADLMAGRYKFSGAGNGSVVNQGTINAADGGYVALLGATVSNEGVISARLGSVALGAGNATTLDVAGDGLLNITIDQGAVDALVRNGGLIKADGGQVFLSAQAAGGLFNSVVNNTGLVQAQTIENRNGVIKLLADMQGGTVNVGGTLDASASNGGNGGFIETSAAHVKVANDVKVTTAATHGFTGSWLIDPTDFTIDSGSGAQISSGIGATTLQNSLTTTAVSIATSATATGSQQGDINVNGALAWSANKLTLTAHHDINVNAVMSATGTASLDLEPASGKVNVALSSSGFTGRVDFSGTGALTINNNVYTVIQDAAALQGMNANLTGHYALGSNIDAAATSTWNGGAGFTPVGNSSTKFAGTFDGLGHTISNLAINRPTTDGVGLFGFANSTSVMRNLGVTGGSVKGRNYVGELFGSNDGSIRNSYATGAVTGASSYGSASGTGGLVGGNNGSISNSYATGAVSGSGGSYGSYGSASGTGGLVGANNGSISNSYATGAVSNSGSAGWYGSGTGGLVGGNNGSISNSYATGAVSSSGSSGGYGSRTGGLVGNNNGSVSNSNAMGRVTGMNYVGGLVGWNANYGSSASISNSYATGAVSGQYYVGGLVGVAMNGLISNSYATGQVTGSNYQGGLAGYSYGNISNSYWNSSLNATAVGTGSAVGATGLTTAQMKVQSNFVGFDFTNTPVWGFSSGINGGYPVLCSISACGVITVYVNPLTGSSIYGTAPVFTYTLVDVNGVAYSLNNASITGAATYALAPTATSNVGIYTFNYSSGLSLSGTGASNYVLASWAPATTWTVTPATLTYTTNAASQTYGTANNTFAGTVTGFVNGQNLTSATTGAAVFSSITNANSNVGSYAITGNGLTANNGNYIFANAAGNASALTISKAALLVTGNSASVTYNGQNQSVAGFTVSGLQGSDTAAVLSSVSASGASAKNAGSYSNTVSAGTETNYTVSAVNGTLNIAKADAVVTANSDLSKVYNGQSQSVSGFTASGLVNGETESVLTGVSASGAGTNAGTYTSTASGSDSNYNLTFASGTLAIAKAALTATGNSASVTYNGQNQSVAGFTVSGLQGSDTAAVLSSVSASGASAKNAGSYSNTVSAGTETNYTVSAVNGTLNIAKADAVVTANSDLSKVYNGQSQSVSGFTASGLVNGETESVLTGVSASGAGTNAGTYTSTASGSDSNYNLTFASGTLAIAKAALTATGNSASVTYNGQNQSVAGFTVSGLQGSDTAAVLSSVSASGASAKNAGSYSNTVSAGTETNYTVSAVNGTLNIAKADAVVTANSDLSKVYNGQSQSVSGFTASGLVNGETESVLTGVSASGAGTNAGTYTSTASGSDSNYNLTFASGTLAIAKAALTATGNSASVTYNGQNQSVAGFTVSGLQGSDTAAVLSSVSASGASAKNAGSYSNTVSAGTETNYTVSAVNGTLNIAKADAVVTANSDLSKVYNGQSQSVSGFTASGLVNGETESVLTGVSASGAGTNAGTYTSTASGSDSNYNLTFASGTLAIAKAALTATGNSASVTYNGQNQSVAGFTVSGLQGSDTAAVLSSVSASGASAKNAGSYSNTVSAGTETNYTVSAVNGTLNIAKADAVVTANSDLSKVYNGQSQSVSGFTASGLVNGETESVLTGVSASGAGTNAGTYTSTASGSDSNYNLTFASGTLAIAKAALTATGNSASVTYNGQNQSVAGFTVSGLQGSDTAAVLSSVSASGASAKNAGSYSNTVSAGTETNYTVSAVNGTLNIAKADAVVTANSDLSKVYNGQSQSVSGFTASGLVNGETESVLTGVSASGAGTNAGTYTSTASGSDSNYNLTFASGTLAIAKAALTATGNSASVTYNGQNQSVAGFTVSGLQGSDTAAVLSSVSASGASAKNAGSYSNTVSAGTETNYTVSAVNGTLNIAKADAVVTANSDLSKVYNGQSQSVSGFTASGLVNGETESVLTGVSASGAGTNAGTYTSTASGSDSNYNLTFASGTLAIAKAPLTVTANNQQRGYGDANPTFTQTVTGFVNGETSNVVIGTATGTSTADIHTGVGSSAITANATGLLATNYGFSTMVNGVLTIGPSPANDGAIANARAQTSIEFEQGNPIGHRLVSKLQSLVGNGFSNASPGVSLADLRLSVIDEGVKLPPGAMLSEVAGN